MNDYKRQMYANKRKRRKKKVFIIKTVLISGMGILLSCFIFNIYSLFTSILKTSSHDGVTGYNKEAVSQAADSGNGINGYASDDRRDAVMEKLEVFAEENNFSVQEYPEDLIALLQKNKETEEFVLNYPLKKDTYSQEQLTEYLNQDTVPLLMQWDSRWGYYQYGDNIMGLTGCGPTCLSMIAIHLLQNPQLTPIYIADYSIDNGYCISGNGTAWELMLNGAKGLGLEAEEVPLDENLVKQHLLNGNPMICILGKGDFTDDGHFVVFKGIREDKIVVNDPNSRERSEKLWEFEDIMGQIRNMWVYKCK